MDTPTADVLTLRDLMSRDVVTLGPEATLREAAELLAARRISGAPVVAGSVVLGTLSIRDLLEYEATTREISAERDDAPGWEEDPFGWEEGEDPVARFFLEAGEETGASALGHFPEPGGPEWDFPAEHTVADAMSRVLDSLPPDTPLSRAAEEMVRRDLHRVLVMEGGKLLGIVTTTDVTRAVAGQGIDASLSGRTPRKEA